ncbi:type II secretion system secretin GspD [Methylobacterium nodulans]|uniref:General secretion pathway protein D n=1 Tax=Methylobacterium nodulans (strain LMG 21967 / CNCM I-2342 / ORS 2060) TaxID=460265 RepID=B8IR79_METNO|nr:type II secretion system secretin GspD [Methylobacterium nodulans]ACL56781.1 general secretion pathway protein D [Methylobacterium nodulans ORS 2060]
MQVARIGSGALLIAGLLGVFGPARSEDLSRATLAGPEMSLDLSARPTRPAGAKAGREGGLVPRDGKLGRSYHFPPEPVETTAGLPIDLNEPLEVGNGPGGEGSYRLNFERADIKDVLRTVLTETLGLSYSLGADISGQITISSPRPLTRAEMLGAIESVLASQGLALTRNGAGYLIAPTALGAGSVNFGAGAQAGYGVSVVPLRYVSAAVMSRLVSGFVTEADGVRFDISRNTIVLKGPGPKRQEAVSAILSLDADWMRGQSVSLFELRRVRPEAVVAELAQLFDTGENGAGSGLIQFKPVSRMRAVLVLSKNPTLIRRAETFIRKLDTMSEAAEENVFVYKARYRDARELARVVNGLFGNGQGGVGPAGPAGTGFAQNRAGAGSGAGGGLGGHGLSGGGLGGSGFGGGGLSAPGGSSLGAPGQQPGGNGTDLLRARFASAFGDAVPAAPADAPGAGTNSAMIDLTTQPGARGRGVAISADPANNSVITYADGDTYKKVYAALRRLDATPAQVAVNVTIAEVRLNDQLKYGVQYFLDSSRIGLGKNKGSFGLVSAAATGATNVLKPGAGFNFLVGGYSGPDVVISALDGFTDVKVLSSPSLVVLENQPATLQVGDSVPITTRQAQSIDYANAPLINQVEFRDTGIILNVIPRIGQNDAVTMQIEQEISAVVGGSDTLTPTISKRRVASTISVANGQTVLLAGLISDKHQRERDGIPFLNRLPQIGQLFSSTDNGAERTELVVFIRPVVVRNGRDAQRVAEDYRGQLLDAGVRRGARAAAPVHKP